MTDTAIEAMRAELAALEAEQIADDEEHAAHKATRRDRVRALKRAIKALGGGA